MGHLDYLHQFDPAFIQPPEHRPNLAAVTEPDGIPSVDLSPIFNNSASANFFPEDLVRQIGSACRDWGFFLVVNHGVPLEKRRRIETAAREFFGQSLEEKRKVRRNEGVVTGYFDTEFTKNVRDWKEVFDFLVTEPTIVPASPELDDDELTQWTNQWPEYPPELREACEEYVEEMEKLSYKLMELIAVSLGLPANRFRAYFKHQTSSVRLNHYPPCPSPDLALGVGHHKDGGALTVLAQDHVGGLEVKRKIDGDWIRVKPVPDSYIINLGDIIQVWSNEKYESVEHRVMVNSRKERYSIPFFFNPSHYTIVEPLKELIDSQNYPSKYKSYSWGKFLTNRKRSNFKKLHLDNVQISHFKISN